MTPQLRAVRDALANNSVQSLAINPDVENQTDALFSHEIKDPGSIADQEKSGRCWLFAGLNLLRPGVIAKEKIQVIIDRRFVPDGLLAVTKQKTVLLPPWDPFTDWKAGP